MHDFFLRYRIFTRLFFYMTLSIFLITFQLRVLDNVVLFIFSPVEKALIYSVDSLEYFMFRYFRLLHVEEEYDRLVQENIRLKRQLIAFEEQNVKLSRLEELFDLTKELPFNTVAARVIGKSPISSNSMLVIDRGSFDGIKKYQGVINKDGVIGRIIGVSRNSAKVQLIDDKNCAIASINQRTRDNGLIRGLGINAPTLQMDFVYYRAQFQVGDVIITSGLDNVFPKGFLIGKVIFLEQGNSDLFYDKVEIEPAGKFNRIEEVIVVLSPAPTPVS